MVFDANLLAKLAVSLLGLAGFLVARHIYKAKKKAQPLVCPVKFDCNTVVHSDYSKFLGAPVERLGMIYYSLIALAYFLLAFIPVPMPELLILVLSLYSLGAFLFSIYLIYVQIFLLKKGCSWCIASSFICLLIFILTGVVHDWGVLLG